MSKLVDDLRKVDSGLKSESGIVIRDADEPRDMPVSKDHKTIYFIGFLIVMIAALSASSMAVSLKTLARIRRAEAVTASSNAEVLAQLENSKVAADSLSNLSNKQETGIAKLQALMFKQNEQASAKMDELKDEVWELKMALKKRSEELDDLKYTQNSLKTAMETSMNDLKLAHKLMADKYKELSEKLKNLADNNAFLYGGY